MQKLNTSRFGVINYDTENTITFPNGIIHLEGYENCTSYYLFEKEDDIQIIYYLQSIKDPELSFTLVDPTFLNIDYDIELNKKEAELLQLNEECDDELTIMLIVYDPVIVEEQSSKLSEEIKAESQSPLIININKKIGIQMVGLNARLIFTPMSAYPMSSNTSEEKEQTADFFIDNIPIWLLDEELVMQGEHLTNWRSRAKDCLNKKATYRPTYTQALRGWYCHKNKRIAWVLADGLIVVDDFGPSLAVHIVTSEDLAKKMVSKSITIMEAKKVSQHLIRIPHIDGYENMVKDFLTNRC